jgi:hypothetical protein
VRDFTGDSVNVTYYKDGAMIDGSIIASKSKHNQPKDPNFQWFMAGFLPHADSLPGLLPSFTCSTNINRSHPSGQLYTSRLDVAFTSSVFIIN